MKNLASEVTGYQTLLDDKEGMPLLENEAKNIAEKTGRQDFAQAFDMIKDRQDSGDSSFEEQDKAILLLIEEHYNGIKTPGDVVAGYDAIVNGISIDSGDDPDFPEEYAENPARIDDFDVDEDAEHQAFEKAMRVTIKNTAYEIATRIDRPDLAEEIDAIYERHGKADYSSFERDNQIAMILEQNIGGEITDEELTSKFDELMKG